MNKLIEIRGLEFAYPDKLILQDLNFDLKRGEFLAIIGENGVGKSTLLKLILQRLSPQKGSISIFGEKPNPRVLEKIAYISQDAVANYPNFPTTVKELVQHHLKYLKSKEKLEACLERMNLHKEADHSLRELSGGQLQRLALLLALIKEVEIIILDEATSGVDQEFSRELYAELKRISTKGKSIIMVTHHLEEALAYIDTVFELKNKDYQFRQVDKWQS